MTHTPTPWHIGMKPGPFIYGVQGETVADLRIDLNTGVENTANATFIVRACNAHDELVAALELWQTRIGCGCGELPCKNCSDAFYKAEQALAKAEKGT